MNQPEIVFESISKEENESTWNSIWINQ